ncbi:MAG: cobalamin-binding protein, partial [Firmicutes bacterium]|nr:cobalamin-binding protein [Bacillota bacterium]
MIDLNELKKAVGELEEEKVMGMLTEFVSSNPTEEEAQKI